MRGRELDRMYLQARLSTIIVVHLLFSTSARGVVFNHNIRVENGDGFLVYPILRTSYPVDSQSVEREQFYIYNQNTATKVTAQFGNLRAEQNISYDLNDYSNADPLSLKVVNVDGGANITAHLVQTTVTNTKPNLKVLVHSDRKLDYDRCVRIFAKRSNSETVSESCILKSRSDNDTNTVICMATVPLPYEWWSSRDIDVYFDVQRLEVCTLTSNYLPSFNLPDAAFYIGEVVLMFDDRHGAKEIMKDANVGLSIPDKSQQPGEEFSATVKLYPGSTIHIFFVRVEVGDGLILKSVNSSDPSRWNVNMRRSGSSSVVDIGAVAMDDAVPSLKVQEVIRCNFEVSRSTIKLEASIRWTIKYKTELISANNEHQKTLITPIPLSKADQVAHLVAVLKTHELVSLRQFTDAVSTIPVWLYAIDKSGKISLVNSRSNCKSTRSSILEVSKQCDMIYLSGEGSDPGIVDVVFDYDSIKHTVDVRVWYPDVQMSIKLTDDRLNEIKGWKLKTETNQVGLDNEIECNLQYQTSDVKVYTKFYTVHDRRDVYMRGGKVEVFADITPHVKHLIQSSNRDVVQYEDGQLRGVGPGKASVKVVSSGGATLAATEVKVASSKADVDRISGNFVSDINMVVSRSDEQGLLVTTYSYERVLSDKLAEGVLELWVHFTDGKVVPLSSFDRLSYRVDIENETPTILALPSDDYSSRYITVRAVGSGRGILKFTLHMDPACQRKSTRYLAVGYVYINSQLSKPAGLFVNDAAYKSDQRRVQLHQRVKPKRKPVSISKSNNLDKIVPVISKTEEVRVDTRNGGQGGGVTPLETGMFVLMGVLGVVASVFVTNCLVYTYRQQKLKKGGEADKAAGGMDGSEKVDSGWVWLNRNTLRENAINTNPEQFLSDRDFQKRCSRSDSLQSTRSKRSSTGTYKGSECSIRITVNPRNILNLPDLSDSDEEDELFSADSCKQPIISIEEPELSDIGCDDDEFSLYSLKSKRRQSAEGSGGEECQQSFIVQDDYFLEEPPQPAKLTQEQFDNLRESVA